MQGVMIWRTFRRRPLRKLLTLTQLLLGCLATTLALSPEETPKPVPLRL